MNCEKCGVPSASNPLCPEDCSARIQGEKEVDQLLDKVREWKLTPEEIKELLEGES